MARSTTSWIAKWPSALAVAVFATLLLVAPCSAQTAREQPKVEPLPGGGCEDDYARSPGRRDDPGLKPPVGGCDRDSSTERGERGVTKKDKDKDRRPGGVENKPER